MFGVLALGGVDRRFLFQISEIVDFEEELASATN
jgi:hypothetical protein